MMKFNQGLHEGKPYSETILHPVRDMLGLGEQIENRDLHIVVRQAYR
jgi:hypothetical protein